MAASHDTLALPLKPTSVKALAESCAFTSVPNNYSYSTQIHMNDLTAPASDQEESMPVVDYSLLISPDPHQRSKAIQDLGKACQDWGFFMLINHGVPESLVKAVLDGCDEFFNLDLDEKQEYVNRDVWAPVRFGTGIDIKINDKVCLWRDFVKAFVHPHFHFPNKPNHFSEVSRELCKRTRELYLELLKGISQSLGLEECYIEKAMDLESGLQLFAANLYPRCPQPELAMGIPAHADHGLLTLLLDNGIVGLQIQHNGKWFNVNALPNSFLVHTADQLEVLSNGKYKSVLHRAVVNNKATRISIALANGPSLETVVSPSPELLKREGHSPAFMPMKYKDYIEFQQRNTLDKIPSLQQLRL